MTLKTLEKIRDAVERRPQELAEARQKGEKVCGYFCTMIPEEIIHSLGLIPVRLGIGGDDRLVELGGRYCSNKNCVFIRESMGLMVKKEDPFVKNSDIVAVAGTCSQMYRLSELIKYYCQVNTFVLGVPKNFYLPEGMEYFRKEMEEFTRQLQEFTGEKLDEARLRRSIELYSNIREGINQIYSYLAMYDSPISWREVFDTIHAGFYLDRDYFLSLLKELIAELNILAPEDKGNADGAPRIMLSGSIIAPGDTKLIQIIEEMDGRIVADDLCSGYRCHNIPTPKENSIHGIADAYIGRVPCGSLPYLSLDTDRRLENISRMISDYKVDGMIYHTLRYCDPFTFKANETKRVFKDTIPFLEIHTEYATSDIESVRTRVEAFFELIHTFKSKRGGREDVNQLQNVS
jgi:benzoyl-CoA reductase/2-hydroxyglutaryl-CoA dehydratase subunit BcrC/BadD/HgdB